MSAISNVPVMGIRKETDTSVGRVYAFAARMYFQAAQRQKDNCAYECSPE